MSSIHGDYRIPPMEGARGVNIAQNLAGIFKTFGDLATQVELIYPTDNISAIVQLQNQIRECISSLTLLVTLLPKGGEARTNVTFLEDAVMNSVDTVKPLSNLTDSLTALAGGENVMLGAVTPTIFNQGMNLICAHLQQLLSHFSGDNNGFHLFTALSIMNMLNNMPCFHRDQILSMPQAPNAFANAYQQYLPNAIGAFNSGNTTAAKEIVDYILTFTPPISDWYNQVSS